MSSRTSSSSSSPAPFEGDYSFVNVVTDGTWPESWGKPPKTRKRITKQQLEMLEDLFRVHSHPSREERQMLALKTGMELRSVTIWLQNKRQLVKKAKGVNGSPSSSGSTSSPPSSASSPAPSPEATHAESPSPVEEESTTRVGSSRPSLDRVASLSEYPSPVRPVASKPTQNAQQAQPPLWSHMPSSPPNSPPPPPYSTKPSGRLRNSTQLHKTTGRPYPPLSRTTSADPATTTVSTTSARQRETERAKLIKPSLTLEWACAQACGRTSVDGTDEEESSGLSLSSQSTLLDEELHENKAKASNDEMQAALALCGLLNG